MIENAESKFAGTNVNYMLLNTNDLQKFNKRDYETSDMVYDYHYLSI